MAYHWFMARIQTIVQLNEELLAGLDAVRASTGGCSRSELIREALELYLSQRSAAAIDAAIVEGYTRIPPADDCGPLALVRAALQEESWDDVPTSPATS